MQEMQLWLTKRDNENLRLREQRDQLMAELNERKHKEGVKLQSTAELKALLDSRSVSIKHAAASSVLLIYKCTTGTH